MASHDALCAIARRATLHGLGQLHMDLILPSWDAPDWVGALSTTRDGGVSVGPYASLNLGDHVGDCATAVARNRERLAAGRHLPGPIRWLNQVHGADVARDDALADLPAADASVSRSADQVLAILTADCLPILLARRDQRAVAAAHAGWRSLAGGVVENTLAALGGEPDQVLAWLGPAIGPQAFEVGDEVRAVFVGHDPLAERAFVANARGRWMADLGLLARQRLAVAGVRNVSGAGLCTHGDPARFFSYRRDGQCGRMATLIWIAATRSG